MLKEENKKKRERERERAEKRTVLSLEGQSQLMCHLEIWIYMAGLQPCVACSWC